MKPRKGVHYCGDCGKKMTYDSELSFKSKGISSWWCLNCSIVEACWKSKAPINAVTSIRRIVKYGKMGEND